MYCQCSRDVLSSNDVLKIEDHIIYDTTTEVIKIIRSVYDHEHKLTAILKSMVSWVVMACSLETAQCFKGIKLLVLEAPYLIHFWGPLSLLSNGYWELFPRIKAAEA
jgi:hypothetical protein